MAEYAYVTILLGKAHRTTTFLPPLAPSTPALN